MKKLKTYSGRRISSKFKGFLRNIPIHILMIVVAIIFLFPFIWMILSSVKPDSEILNNLATFLPQAPTFENYKFAFEAVPLVRNFLNSIFIAVSSTLLSLFFTSLGGFAFAKFDFPGKNILFSLMLGTMMIPTVVGIVPSFLVMSWLGWVDKLASVIIPGVASAFGIFFMRQYISSVPNDLLDAAKIDGCSDFRIYYQIVLPIIMPALVTIAIMDFFGSWNSYLWPLIMLRSLKKFTVVLAVTAFPSARFSPPWGAIMAGTTLSVLPLIIVFIVLQNHFKPGSYAGTIK